MKCEFCKKELGTLSALNYHKKTAKYCLEIQGKINENYKCEYCNKNYSTPQHLKEHSKICKSKILKNNSIEDENKLLKDENKTLREENSILKNEINMLKGQLMVLDKNQELIYDIAKQPKTTKNTTTNILSIQSPLDFDNLEKVKTIINEKYNDSYLIEGQKGIAKFAVENILTDENGNLAYICTDPSRQIFKYKDVSGDIRKDIEAKKITNFLINGGIQNKSTDMFIKLWSDKDGKIDGEKCSELLEKADAMMKLKNDNTIFKKELIYMTTKN